MSVAVKTVCSTDESVLRDVAKKVFAAYDGQGRHWALDSRPDIWPIHMGDRAGVVGVDYAGRRLCVKVFYDGNPKARVRNALRCSKASRAYRCGLKLMEHSIPVPAMVGMAQQGAGIALVVTDLIEDAERLDLWIKENGSPEATARSLGVFVGQLHAEGITHQDLSPRNLLVRASGADFLLLDYEDARFFTELSEEQQLDDLHHLNERAWSSVPEEIRKVFLASYLADASRMDIWCRKLNQLIRARPSKYTIQEMK